MKQVPTLHNFAALGAGVGVLNPLHLLAAASGSAVVVNGAAAAAASAAAADQCFVLFCLMIVDFACKYVCPKLRRHPGGHFHRAIYGPQPTYWHC